MAIEEIDPKVNEKPKARCSECDREVDHYNTWLSPTGERRVICWQCVARAEKGFNAKRNFRREARSGYIPR
jgi:hypothetical protein